MDKNFEKKHEKNIIAIDIGVELIKIFSGSVTPVGNLEVANIGIVPSQGYFKGEIENFSELSLAIKQSLDCVILPDSDKSDTLIYLGIGAVFIQGQNVVGSIAPAAVGKVTQDDIDRACRAAVFAVINEENEKIEVLHALPISIDSSLKGTPENPAGLLEEEQGLKVDVHIVSAPKPIIEGITEALSFHDIAISGIVSSSIVTAQAVISNLEQTQPPSRPSGILLDIGAGTADIAVFEEGIIKYSSTLPLGGNYITNDIMQGIGVSFIHAEAIKRYYSKVNSDFYGQSVNLDCNDFGTTDKYLSYDFLHDIIESRIDEIVYLICQHLKPKLKEHLTSKFSGKLILAGGSALLPSLVDKLSKSLELEAEIINFEKLAPEYNCPTNAACYGIFSHAASQIQPQNNNPASDNPDISSISNSSGSWQLFKRNLKKIFKM